MTWVTLPEDWSLIQSYNLTVTFCKLGRSLRKLGIPIKTCQQNSFYYVLTNFEPIFEPVPGPFMITIQKQPLHDMACVHTILRGWPQNVAPPPVAGGDFVRFNMEQSLFFVGTNNTLWRRLGLGKTLMNANPIFLPRLPAHFPCCSLWNQFTKRQTQMNILANLNPQLCVASRGEFKKKLYGTCRRVHSWQTPRTVMSDLWPITECRCKLLKFVHGADNKKLTWQSKHVMKVLLMMYWTVYIQNCRN